MKKRLLSILLVCVMLVSLLPTFALAAPVYGDTNGHWAADAIDRWSGYGVVNGKGEGSFDPDGQMTRAEAAQVFANLLGLNKEGDISAYPDAQGEWYSEAIAKCVAAGILNGKGAGKMDPNGTVTREEFLTMYARAVCISNGADVAQAKSELEQKGFADTAKVSDWAADSIGTLVEKGFVNGLTATELAPQANINRASVMALLNQSISTYVGKDSTETTVAAKSEGITLIANPAVTTVTGTADVVVVAAGAEQYDTATGEITHNDIRVESAKMPVARVQGENITVTLALSTTAEDATVTETGVDSVIVIESTAAVKNAAVAAEGAKIIVKDGAKAESVTVAETAKSATVETAKNATVGTVTIAAESATASVAGKVETVKVEETAKNATIDTKSTAKVETVENKAENTAVTGTGSVGAVKSSEDVKIETKNTKVENTSETKDIAVTDSKGKETKVDSGSTGQTTPSAPTGGGDSHSHRYATEWTYDETNHWHAATCGHDVVSGKAAHSFDATTHRCECGAFASDIVAAIGDQGYKTFAEAAAVISATPQMEDLTVNIIGDCSCTSGVSFGCNLTVEVLDGVTFSASKLPNGVFTVNYYYNSLTLCGKGHVELNGCKFIDTFNADNLITIQDVSIAGTGKNTLVWVGQRCPVVVSNAKIKGCTTLFGGLPDNTFIESGYFDTNIEQYVPCYKELVTLTESDPLYAEGYRYTTKDLSAEKAVAYIERNGDKVYFSDVFGAVNKAEVDETVVLMKDTTYSTTTTKFQNAVPVTLDLNGKTLITTAKYIVCDGSETLTIKNGGITSTNSKSALNIEKGTKLVLDDVTVFADKFVFECDNVSSGKPSGNIVVKSGNYTGTDGIFNDKATKSDHEYSFSITGGTFNANPPVVFVAEGCGVKENGNDTWTVTAPVAEIVETAKKYSSLAAAIADAATGQTIKMLCDTEYTDVGFELNGVNLNLGGHTIKVTRKANTSPRSFVLTGKVTVSNGKFVGDMSKAGRGIIYVDEGANATVENLHIISKCGEEPAYGVANYSGKYMQDPNGTLVINGGTFDCYVGTNGSTRRGTMTINDGTFNGGVYLPAYMNYTINGGTFNNYVEIRSGIINITGGAFNYKEDDPSIEFNANKTNVSIEGYSIDLVGFNGPIGNSGDSGYGPTPVLTITGGTFAGKIGLCRMDASYDYPTVTATGVTVETVELGLNAPE